MIYHHGGGSHMVEFQIPSVLNRKFRNSLKLKLRTFRTHGFWAMGYQFDGNNKVMKHIEDNSLKCDLGGLVLT